MFNLSDLYPILTKDNEFGAWESKSASTIYQAETDGIIVSYSSASAGSSAITIVSDYFSPPSTVRFQDYSNTANVDQNTAVCPIKKGDYWELSSTKSVTIYWLPIIKSEAQISGAQYHLIINDTKPDNTDGGTFTKDAWRTRDLNTEVYNTISGAKLGTGKVTENMTNATTPSPQVVTRSAESASSGSGAAYNIFGGTKGSGSLYWQVTSFSGPDWVAIDLGDGNATAVKRYKLHATSDQDRCARDFILQGSDDGSLWTDLDTQTNQSWSSGYEEKSYSFVNTTAYRHYRLYVTAIQSGSTLGIMELELYDQDISENQFTLPAGTYLINAFAPAYRVDRNKAKLRNITDGSDTLIGTSEHARDSGVNNTRSFVVGSFTIAETKVFEIQHRSQSTKAPNGFGVASDFGVDEIYTQAHITKIA